ncbi:MAG: hypothetical protein QOC70_1779 [Verrucomicrobiota bacterium]
MNPNEAVELVRFASRNGRERPRHLTVVPVLDADEPTAACAPQAIRFRRK